MLPQYVLSEATTGLLVLGLCEWEDILPDSASGLSVKPLYVSRMADAVYEHTRVIGEQALFDLKTYVVKNERRQRTERELAEQVRPFLPAGAIDEVTSLLHVDRTSAHRIWDAPLLSDHIACDRFSQDLTQLLRTVIGEQTTDAVSRARLIGSRLYADEPPAASTDIDIALVCSPAESQRLRALLSKLRIRSPNYTPRDSFFAFPFRIQLGDFAIDIQPSLPKEVLHPLKGVKAWERVSGPRLRHCNILDTSLGAYAWPTYRTSGEPEYITLLSNGFRGSLAAGDQITLTGQTFRMVSSSGEMLVDMVVDPWNNIAEADALFDFSRDACFC